MFLTQPAELREAWRRKMSEEKLSPLGIIIASIIGLSAGAAFIFKALRFIGFLIVGGLIVLPFTLVKRRLTAKNSFSAANKTFTAA
ncbi:MAG: hypothetical protein RIE56_01170 [Amphiplicatus sp.]